MKRQKSSNGTNVRVNRQAGWDIRAAVEAITRMYERQEACARKGHPNAEMVGHNYGSWNQMFCPVCGPYDAMASPVQIAQRRRELDEPMDV